MNWCNVDVDIAANTSEQAYDVEWIGATSTSTLQPTNLSRHITLNELVQRRRRHCSKHIWAGIWRWMNWCNVDVDIPPSLLNKHHVLAGQVHTVNIQHLNNIVSTSQKIYDIAATWLHFFIFHYFNYYQRWSNAMSLWVNMIKKQQQKKNNNNNKKKHFCMVSIQTTVFKLTHL